MEANLMPITEVDRAGVVSAFLTGSTVREVSTSRIDNLALLLL